MDENDKPVLIYSTFPSPAEAERIGGALVDRGLAACVNILPGMTAIYVWEGKRQRETEAVMIIKTRASLADTVIAEARKLHPYTNPALVVLPVDRRLGGLPALDRGADGEAGLRVAGARLASARRCLLRPSRNRIARNGQDGACPASRG